MRGLLAAPLALLACAPGALAAPTVTLTAGLRPKRLGHVTTVQLQMRISPGAELAPPPLIAAEVSYPAGLDVQLSGLGIDACSAATLAQRGLKGCPPDSVMGYGSAIAELPIGGEVFRETAKIAIVRTGQRHGHLALLFYIYGEPALSAEIVLHSELLPARTPFGGRLAIELPLVSTFPEAPYVSVGAMSLVVGPQSLSYVERVDGKAVHYKPAGLTLPGRCLKGGFHFAVALRFLGGATARASTVVPCPR